MSEYNEDELLKAKKSIISTLNKCEKAIEKLKDGTSAYTLTRRRMDAFKISIALIDEKLGGVNK